MKTMPDRIWTKIEIGPECWEWKAYRLPSGYGKVGFEGKTLYAHRVVYEHLKAPIPDGLHIDHLCRNRGCVRPSHLEPVEPATNIRRGKSLKYPDDQAWCPKCGAEMYKSTNRSTRRGWHWACRPCRNAAQRRRRRETAG
jgi:hypothetical protein